MAERNDSMSDKAEDRRDSPRVPMRLRVRRAGNSGPFESQEGDLSLGGCAWQGSGLEAGAKVEVRFKLPILPDEVEATGEVLQVSQGAQGPLAHVRFLDLPVEAELAIARHLDDVLRSGGGTR
ncbi:PilZ domain-containing protein [Pyxidicoccus xibeiensis]|uniref:PilZ domain-containing protein n=1 Tax=Pyxidicoccus xibeiensis TaxID=2906759 RepID=UPI0020A76B84|nr:PilZ domain-containing protein [Pyxidicoccus xibeiensis]MCP3144069.1 PilZ domain-containing protein [Pyxidicoccus xibeiensis]